MSNVVNLFDNLRGLDEIIAELQEYRDNGEEVTIVGIIAKDTVGTLIACSTAREGADYISILGYNDVVKDYILRAMRGEV